VVGRPAASCRRHQLEHQTQGLPQEAPRRPVPPRQGDQEGGDRRVGPAFPCFSPAVSFLPFPFSYQCCAHFLHFSSLYRPASHQLLGNFDHKSARLTTPHCTLFHEMHPASHQPLAPATSLRNLPAIFKSTTPFFGNHRPNTRV
jgi:hypothetical protein